MTISGVHHFAIKVRDLGAAERFYVGVLGLRVSRRWPAAGGGDRSLWVDLDEANGADGGPFLAIETLTDPSAVGDFPAPEATATERPGHHLVAFRIRREQRAAWEARLTEAGVAISHRSDYTLYFSDPEGNRLGLSHHPEPAYGG
jgi:glyoxylase I family protein